MKKTFKILSLFTGCGGLDLGFEMAKKNKYKFKVVWANDNLQHACRTFKRNFHAPISEEDVWNIDFKKVPDCDVILAGFPCQDFSVLSKRKGINVKRGMLYTRIVDALKVKKPLFFVAENVKGLLSANKRKAIKIIKRHFEDAGYKVNYDLIKFVEYGVPQKRERVVFVGFRNDLNINYDFPKSTVKKYVTVKEALKGVEKVKFNNEKQNLNPHTIKMLKAIPPGGNYKDLPKGLKVKGLMSNIYRRLHPNEPSVTIIANGGGGTWGYHHKEPRSLTNRERARLQTFPDNFVFIGTIGEVRTQIGNAVPPLGAKVIAESILKIFSKKRRRKRNLPNNKKL
jgi:DNA (cytosine-5)-methyltransferase 1